MSTKAVTSKRVATISSLVLRNKTEDARAKSAAGSALGQTPERRMTLQDMAGAKKRRK